MEKQRNKSIRTLIIFICFAALVVAICVCFYGARENLRVEMRNTLRDVAQQNNIAVSKEISTRFLLLENISKEFPQNPQGIDEIMVTWEGVVQNYKFRRMGFVSADGTLYSTDGYTRDMSNFDFFRLGMGGEATLTDGTDEWADADHSHISRFAVPVYDEEQAEIIGVVYAAAGVKWIQDVLNTQAFEGRGYSCIVKTNGDVIAHSQDSPIGDVSNFFSCFERENEEESYAVEEIKQAMQTGKSGVGSFVLKGEQDFYYTPLYLKSDELSRYMITIVPTEILVTRMQPILEYVESMLFIIVMFMVCSMSVFLLSQHSRRKELEKLAYTDGLTKGDNFSCFQEKMKKKKGVHGYLVAMDLSDFKIINNTCGVDMGDEVLRHVWKVLHNSISENELAARIYADRFILFVVEDYKEVVRGRLDKLVAAMEKISEELHTPRVVPIFGVYETTNSQPLETDYGKAVQAKHLVKGRRDRKYAFYEEIDYNQVLEKRGIEDGFEKAIEEKQFEIWYQPKFDAQNGEIVGAEALVRWRKEDGSLLPPFKFIPIFEKNGMIPRLDEYVFRTVCMQQKKWEQEGRKILPVSVNISRVSLYYYNIVEKYKIISAENAVATKHLQLEITESATIDNAEISNLMEQFHTAGFEMLLDDFGSGYSSLSSLNMMHFDTLKLDKSLIDYIGDENGEMLLHYIMRLGQNLGLRVTAEGVETKEQVEFLRKLKCNDIQGYYFSKPLRAEEYEKLLA